MHPISLLFHDVYVRRPDESGFSSPAADCYKLTVADFAAQLDGLDALAADQAPQVTVDDGGVSFYTVIASRLESRDWRGWCFVSTDLIGRPGFLSASQIRDLDRRGHVIGSHSASHPSRFSALSPDEMRHEWSSSRRALEDILGHSVSAASVPGGYFSPRVARAAAEAGLTLLFTSEPVCRLSVVEGCRVAGRFTIRRGARHDLGRRLVARPPWARWAAWLSWNSKALVKPLLGGSYPRIAGWVHALRPTAMEER